MKNFLIGGYIVDDQRGSESFEDVRPAQVKSFLEGLEENEEVEF